MGAEIDPAELVSKRRLAAQLEITARGLNKIIARGELPKPFRIGRQSYWRKLSLVGYYERLERRAS